MLKNNRLFNSPSMLIKALLDLDPHKNIARKGDCHPISLSQDSKYLIDEDGAILKPHVQIQLMPVLENTLLNCLPANELVCTPSSSKQPFVEDCYRISSPYLAEDWDSSPPTEEDCDVHQRDLGLPVIIDYTKVNFPEILNTMVALDDLIQPGRDEKHQNDSKNELPDTGKPSTFGILDEPLVNKTLMEIEVPSKNTDKETITSAESNGEKYNENSVTVENVSARMSKVRSFSQPEPLFRKNIETVPSNISIGITRTLSEEIGKVDTATFKSLKSEMFELFNFQGQKKNINQEIISQEEEPKLLNNNKNNIEKVFTSLGKKNPLCEETLDEQKYIKDIFQKHSLMISEDSELENNICQTLDTQTINEILFPVMDQENESEFPVLPNRELKCSGKMLELLENLTEELLPIVSPSSVLPLKDSLHCCMGINRQLIASLSQDTKFEDIKVIRDDKFTLQSKFLGDKAASQDVIISVIDDFDEVEQGETKVQLRSHSYPNTFSDTKLSDYSFNRSFSQIDVSTTQKYRGKENNSNKPFKINLNFGSRFQNISETKTTNGGSISNIDFNQTKNIERNEEHCHRFKELSESKNKYDFANISTNGESEETSESSNCSEAQKFKKDEPKTYAFDSLDSEAMHQEHKSNLGKLFSQFSLPDTNATNPMSEGKDSEVKLSQEHKINTDTQRDIKTKNYSTEKTKQYTTITHSLVDYSDYSSSEPFSSQDNCDISIITVRGQNNSNSEDKPSKDENYISDIILDRQIDQSIARYESISNHSNSSCVSETSDSEVEFRQSQDETNEIINYFHGSQIKHALVQTDQIETSKPHECFCDFNQMIQDYDQRVACKRHIQALCLEMLPIKKLRFPMLDQTSVPLAGSKTSSLELSDEGNYWTVNKQDQTCLDESRLVPGTTKLYGMVDLDVKNMTEPSEEAIQNEDYSRHNQEVPIVSGFDNKRNPEFEIKTLVNHFTAISCNDIENQDRGKYYKESSGEMRDTHLEHAVSEYFSKNQLQKKVSSRFFKKEDSSKPKPQNAEDPLKQKSELSPFQICLWTPDCQSKVMSVPLMPSCREEETKVHSKFGTTDIKPMTDKMHNETLPNESVQTNDSSLCKRLVFFNSNSRVSMDCGTNKIVVKGVGLTQSGDNQAQSYQEEPSYINQDTPTRDNSTEIQTRSLPRSASVQGNGLFEWPIQDPTPTNWREEDEQCVPQSRRPIRVGLSKRARLNPLHHNK
uniref:Uncharacterized protein n=1 Tax=Timema bartmani TaxID=61472 RepID=A0A7R9HYS0_9NEOP|nr:unnamed protein product [Timema bartmani]